MKSIQSKIILLICVGIIVSIAIIGSVGILSFKHAIDDDSVKIMNLTCSEKAQELNNVLGKIEQSVEIMAVHAIDALESVERLSGEPDYLEEYTRHIDGLGLTIANETDGALAVYIRFNPDITSPQAGFFRVKNEESGEFEKFELTDFTEYSPEDVEHVGWYYIPVNAGKAIWMQPYYNQNVDVYMISYVIPIYKEDALIGIVGMDIDFDFLTKQTDSIQVYETGHAFLTDENFNIVYSKHYPWGTPVREFSKPLANATVADIISMNTLYDHTLNGEEKKVAFRQLKNGMCLAVTVPVSEIERAQNTLVVQIGVMAFIVIVAFVFIAGAIARTIIKPLKELDIAAKEIAGGNLEVSLACKSKDEIGTLSESLRETAKQLKIRIDYINSLAYLDKLTGKKNNTAYLHEVSEIKEELQRGEGMFSVFIIDLNGLKAINDNYGHDYGNKLIIAAAEVVAEVFGAEHVYRIGGDEFAVIIRDVSHDKCRELERKFERVIQKPIGEIRLSVAIGSAVYDKNTDSDYESVFKRADAQMYQRKLQMKARGEKSTIEV